MILLLTLAQEAIVAPRPWTAHPGWLWLAALVALVLFGTLYYQGNQGIAEIADECRRCPGCNGSGYTNRFYGAIKPHGRMMKEPCSVCNGHPDLE